MSDPHHDGLPPHLRQEADQFSATANDLINKLIATARRSLDGGTDRTDVIAVLMFAMTDAGLTLERAILLAAVAIMNLADPPVEL